ncbi:uncharacterized protein LOC135301553 isoform X2 [Passer domesticus]|uniref:uncharacterized protein LOC135301553 isoform X2 n=1 Tax=Passer domesticus TaxID=48849 RepID=UPI0030FE5E09
MLASAAHGRGTCKTEIFKLSVAREVQIQFQECWPVGKAPLTFSVLTGGDEEVLVLYPPCPGPKMSCEDHACCFFPEPETERMGAAGLCALFRGTPSQLEILYVRLHQRIKIDASQHVSHSCTLQLRASLLGDMAESLERAEHPFPVMGATLGSPQPPPAARGLEFTEEDMSSRQLLLVGYAEQDAILGVLPWDFRTSKNYISAFKCVANLHPDACGKYIF